MTESQSGKWLLFLIVCLASLAPITLHAGEPKVLLIGIDGLRSDAFAAAKTPNLDRLAENGLLVLNTRVTSDAVERSDTVSGPGWTTFLTGTWADRHGVVDNSFQGRDVRRGPHLFQLLKGAKPTVRTASFVNWPPIDQFITTDADINVVVHSHAKPDQPKKKDYAAADRSVAAMACQVLNSDPVDIAFVYLGAVDETGHSFGFHPAVKPYVDQITSVDGLVGKLLSAVQSRPDYENEDWLYVVSTDHGGAGLGHGGGRAKDVVRAAPMIVSGPAAVKQQREGVVPTTTDVAVVAMRHLGVQAKQEWGLAGRWENWLEQEVE